MRIREKFRSAIKPQFHQQADGFMCVHFSSLFVDGYYEKIFGQGPIGMMWKSDSPPAVGSRDMSAFFHSLNLKKWQ